ncbi:MAG: PilC/PilY family type IV pilus protein [Tolumonas sp.]|nr:PilC/PilY family type IV pilus protein [Tolumonas sp.]
MRNLMNLKSLFWLSLLSLGVASPLLYAEDIDIFTSNAGGTEAAPNILFLLENTSNWTNNNQKFPPATTGSAACKAVDTQGAAEKCAISNVVGAISDSNIMNVGLAEFNTMSAYIRFGVRNMNISANKSAFQQLMSNIDINDNSEKINEKGQIESAAFYEIYKYFEGLTPYKGAYSLNSLVDVSGNTKFSKSGLGLTATTLGATCDESTIGQQCGLQGSASSGSGDYNGPDTSCSSNYVIFILNNNNAQAVDSNTDKSTYEGVSVSSLAPSGTSTWPAYWAKYLYQHGISVYVIDVYNEHQSTTYTTIAQQIAKLGGGKYFHAASTDTLNLQLSQIFAEINAKSQTFASSSLPVSTTNRAQEKNQVFIPMFRPDAHAAPRWMGNMKQYQLITVGNSVELGDSSTPPIQALNNNNGLPTDCAVSFWTTPSNNPANYWENVNETPLPSGDCSATTEWSDSPDGPVVEKGGAAEVIRKGNNPPTTNDSPTWAVNRTIYTQALAGGALTAFNTTNSGLTDSVVKFTRGEDVFAEYITRTAPSTLTRPSLHGDTIHSRPLPIDYGSKVVVYYGSNDGMFRAVDANDGKEIWAFVAPEHYSKLQRIYDNSPLISYPGMMPDITPTPTPKGYFFDGSIGLYQNSDNTKIWIYPSMRRGGRMLYAFNITSSSSPAFKWKIGCPNLTNDDSCTSDSIKGIGQTWSTPQVAEHIVGYDKPVVIVGGGYDSCEDADTVAPSCSSPKGAGVYVLDADTGEILKTFTTTRSVAADVALISHTVQGTVDHAYVSDTGGNIYRIDFDSDNIEGSEIHRIAYTNGNGRKFFYPPALLTVGNTIYLAIGSGDREHPLYSQYPYANVENRFYVFTDDLTKTGDTITDYSLDGSDMTDKTLDLGCSSTTIIGSGKKGWFMKLNENGQGEQAVTSALITSGLIVFSTNQPVAPAEGTCSTNLGIARGYWVNIFNGSGAVGVSGICGGTRSEEFVGEGGLPPSPIFAVVPIDGVPTTVVIGAVQKEGGASSSIAPQEVVPNTNLKRHTVYWKSSGNN